MYTPLGSYVAFDTRRRERIAAFVAGVTLGLAGAAALVTFGVIPC
ncbi:MAG TPA: hypothetical protein VFV90_07630 [Usitatibacter sp.]|nr:hypothetical protein [Usitatibacter sp.]